MLDVGFHLETFLREELVGPSGLRPGVRECWQHDGQQDCKVYMLEL